MNTTIIKLTVVAFLGTLLFAHADSVRLDELDITAMTADWGQPQKNQSVTQTPLVISGEKFDHGVGTHAASKVMLQLDGKAKLFTAKVGVNDDAGDASASVEFIILGDGHELWHSDVCKLGDKPRDCSVNLDGIKSLELMVDPRGDGINYDHADWADATFAFDGAPPQTVPIAPAEQAVVLTPPSPPTPLIHGAKIFGVRPGSPFLFTVAATGDRPMTFSADNLPPGLVLDSNTGRITGAVSQAGDYQVTLRAKNALGETQRPFLIKVGNTIALTPPMGWNSWNCFAGAVSDAKIRAAADALVKSGLINHGWTYVNIDDFWQINPKSKDETLHGPERDASGTILPNSRFPDMKALADYIHAQGLKAGLYSSPGPYTCGGCTGSYQHEEQDAAQYAAWSFDYLKYDWCTYGKIYQDSEGLDGKKKPYRVMAEALGKANRDIVFSFCQYGWDDVWKWGTVTGGNSWRTTGDIRDNWQSMMGNASRGNGIESYAGPGHWNDPDMLVVGWVGWGPQLHATHLTPDEQYTHISLWCLQAAPLLIGCDLTQLDPFTLGLLTNDEVIDIDQDPLGQAAHRVKSTTAARSSIQIWARQLEDGSTAVGLFNLGNAPAAGMVNWSDLQLTGSQTVRDLWRQKDLGTFDQKFESEPIPAHGVVLIRLIKS